MAKPQIPRGRWLPWLLPGVYLALVLAYALWMALRGTWPWSSGLKVAGAAVTAWTVGVLLAVWLSPRRGAQVGLLLTTLLLAAWSTEAIASWVVRQRDPIQQAAARAAARGEPYDLRSRRQTLDALRADDPRVYPALYRPTLQSPDYRLPAPLLFALAGPSFTRSLHVNELGYTPVITSDEHGFTNPSGLHQPGKVDVLFLGDSYTQGIGVDLPDSFVGRVRLTWPRTVNLGLAGNGPLANLASWREYGERLRPRHVVYVHCEHNDLPNLAEEGTTDLARYRVPAFRQGLAEHQPTIDRVLLAAMERDLRIPVAPSGVAFDLLLFRKTRWLAGLAMRGMVPKQEPDPTGCFEGVLALLQQEVRNANGTLLFVYLPDSFSFIRPGIYDEAREQVLGVTRRLGLETIDLLPAFRRYPNPLTLYVHPGHPYHLSVAGHELVASEINRALGDRRNSAP